MEGMAVRRHQGLGSGRLAHSPLRVVFICSDAKCCSVPAKWNHAQMLACAVVTGSSCSDGAAAAETQQGSIIPHAQMLVWQSAVRVYMRCMVCLQRCKSAAACQPSGIVLRCSLALSSSTAASAMAAQPVLRQGSINSRCTNAGVAKISACVVHSCALGYLVFAAMQRSRLRRPLALSSAAAAAAPEHQRAARALQALVPLLAGRLIILQLPEMCMAWCYVCHKLQRWAAHEGR